MNKKQKNRKLPLIIALVVLAVMSFGPCVYEVHTYVIDSFDVFAGDSFSKTMTYMPIFFCFVSALEIMLILISNRRWSRIIGIFFHLFKMIVPFFLYSEGVFLSYGGLTSITYRFSWFGYIFLAVGVATLVLYVLNLKNIISDEK